jgi:hypothetical protein
MNIYAVLSFRSTLSKKLTARFTAGLGESTGAAASSPGGNGAVSDAHASTDGGALASERACDSSAEPELVVGESAPQQHSSAEYDCMHLAPGFEYSTKGQSLHEWLYFKLDLDFLSLLGAKMQSFLSCFG